MSELLRAALDYARIGWHIFPLLPGRKEPATAHGVKDATIDLFQISRWWSSNPKYNIGLACGAKSGVYVIDVDLDVEKGIDGYATYEAKFKKANGELPDTIRQNTPRGGFHAFFRTNDSPANKNNWYPGIDIRGDGYYVLLSPSIHPNGKVYSWVVGHKPGEIPSAEYPDWMRPAKLIPWVLPESRIPHAGITQVARGIQQNDKLRRASLYLSECDPAIQGCGGHDKLLWAAVAMVHGFLLTNEEAYNLLASEYNPRCIPEWDLSSPSDRKDFERKVGEARKLKPQFRSGWLLEDEAYITPPEPSAAVSAGALEMIRKHYEDNTKPAIVNPTGVQQVLQSDELEYLQNPPGVVGEICQWINRTAIKKQPFLSLACTLTFFGSVLGRKVKDRLENRTNLYCMGVAPSSAGKAHAPNQIRKLCEHAGTLDLLGGDEAASDAAIECRLERNPSTLFLWDEIGLLLSYIQSGSNPHVARIVSLLMKLYSSAGSVYKGREYAEEDKQRTVMQPCCCIYGTSTPSRFQEGITLEELQDGWLSRCLVFESIENPPKTRDNCSEQVPPDVSDLINLWYSRDTSSGEGKGDIESFSAFQSRTGSILGKPPEQIVILATTDAEKKFLALDEESLEIGRANPVLACLWAKTEENARKIALIIAAGVEFEKPVITAHIAEYSCRLIRFILTKFVNDTIPRIVSSKVDANKKKILDIIGGTGREGCLTRHITRNARWSTKKQRSELIGDLIEGGEVTVAPDPGGKGTRFWTTENFQEVQNGNL
jgi:hypothetical protein